MQTLFESIREKIHFLKLNLIRVHHVFLMENVMNRGKPYRTPSTTIHIHKQHFNLFFLLSFGFNKFLLVYLCCRRQNICFILINFLSLSERNYVAQRLLRCFI